MNVKFLSRNVQATFTVATIIQLTFQERYLTF